MHDGCTKRGFGIALASTALAACAAGQVDDGLERRVIPYPVDSGIVRNDGTERGVVFAAVVSEPSAVWLQVRFAEVSLAGSVARGTASTVRLTSTDDGASQELNAVHLAQWQHASAFFNGGEVLIELISHPGTGDNRLVVESLAAGPPAGGLGASICGPDDDRQPSQDMRVARGWRQSSTACTAWIIDDCRNCMITAGHCNYLTQVHFRVPLSDPNGNPRISHPDDQYAVDRTSLQYQDGGIGSDWTYFGCFANPNTGLTPVEAQGDAFHLAPLPPPVQDQTIRITGHGVTDSRVPREWNRAQTTHTGPYHSFESSTLQYTTDTSNGNSGSPIIVEETGEAIGVHTHAGCNSQGGANRGTGVNNARWQAALASPLGVCVCPSQCRGGEAIKKAACKARRVDHKLTVKLVGGGEGDAYHVEADGRRIEGTLNDRGKGKAKFFGLGPGGGTAEAFWDCGAQDGAEYVCQ